MSEPAVDDTIIWESLAALAWPWRLAALLVQAHNSDESYGRLWLSGKSFSGRTGLGNDEEKVERLYEEARMVRTEIDALWNEAQATDVAVKGAVSAAQTDDLSDSERDFAISFGLQNAEKWHKLAKLSERLGGLIGDIERATKELKA